LSAVICAQGRLVKRTGFSDTEERGPNGGALTLPARTERIDVHSHFISADVLAEIRRVGVLCDSPYEEREGVGIFVHTPERPYGPIKQPFHDVNMRLAYMDEVGIDKQVLVAPPFVFYYWSSAPEAHALMQLENDGIAEVTRHPSGRFLGFGTVMLNNVPASVREVERIKGLGLVGVEIGSNVNGGGLDDPQLFAFYAAMESLDLALLIHPHNVAGKERMPDYHLRNLLGFPLDTTLAASQLIFSGVLDRFPKLRICLGQAGGFLPYIIGRLDAGYGARPECRRNINRRPSEYLRHFYYDTIIHSPHSSSFLIDTVGADRVMLGSDFPFDMNAVSPISDIEGQSSLTAAQRNAIYHTTAMEFLGLNRITAGN
jgi:aminocarboxymuconate-semialdehyde decarboxylase